MANANDLVIKRERQQLSDAFNKGRMHERNAAAMTIAGGRRERPAENPPPGGNPGKPPWPGYPGPMPPGKDWFAKGPQLPNFKPMGPVIKGVREGVLPLKDTKIKQQLQIGPQAGASSRKIRDSLKPFTKGSGYDKEGGSLRGIPTPLRIQLLRDAMAKNELPGNNRRSLESTGHMTIPDPKNKGRLKIIDLLGPQPPQA